MSATSIQFPLDNDGFLSQECPACNRRFKVRFGSGSSEPVSCCPYCGKRGQGCWWTPEQARYVEAVARARIVGPAVDTMAREFNRSMRSSPGLPRIRMTSPPAASEPAAPLESNDTMPLATFRCCGEQIKYESNFGEPGALRCVICGHSAAANPV